MAPGKYARWEHERRYLLHEPPPDLDLDRPEQRIEDVYLPDTRLRLRKVVLADGLVLRKLTQKWLTGSFGTAEMTTLYLDEAEWELISGALTGLRLDKWRYRYPEERGPYVIDVFRGGLRGLVLAEIELPTPDALAAHRMPAWAIRDVTDDQAYRGGNLARLGVP